MTKNIIIISTLLLFSTASAHAQGIPSDTSNDMEKGSANPIANNTPINTNDAIEGDAPKPNAQLPMSTDEKAGTVSPTTQTHKHRHKQPVDSSNTPSNDTDANPMGAGR